MKIAALTAWLVTAGGGFVMFGLWLAGGGLRRQGAGESRFAPGLIFGHLGLAVAGLAAWAAFVITEESVLAWVAVALLVPVAGLGFAMLAKWLGGRGSTDARRQPEQRFPPPVVVAHGVAAVTTVVLAVVAAATS